MYKQNECPKVAFELFLTSLDLLGTQGLEHHNGAHVIEEYITSYCCKGNANTTNLDGSIDAICEKYCSNN